MPRAGWGRAEADRVLKRYYGELFLALAGGGWNVQSFCYDWRKDLNVGAIRSPPGWRKSSRQAGSPGCPRLGGPPPAFLARHPDRWRRMWDGDARTPDRRGGRLVLKRDPHRDQPARGSSPAGDLLRAVHEREAGFLRGEGLRAGRARDEGGAEASAARARSEKADAELTPTRVTLALEGTSYRFGALTSEASVPRRAVAGSGARAADERTPRRRGRPRPAACQGTVPPAAAGARRPSPGMDTPAPLVMMLDRDTAKIHWEMVAQPEPIDSEAFQGLPLDEGDDPFNSKYLISGPSNAHSLRVPHGQEPHYLILRPERVRVLPSAHQVGVL